MYITTNCKKSFKKIWKYQKCFIHLHYQSWKKFFKILVWVVGLIHLSHVESPFKIQPLFVRVNLVSQASPPFLATRYMRMVWGATIMRNSLTRTPLCIVAVIPLSQPIGSLPRDASRWVGNPLSQKNGCRWLQGIEQPCNQRSSTHNI